MSHEHRSEVDAFEARARAAFDESVDGLDAATRSRLNQARQRALEIAAGRRRAMRRWATWLPTGALAAGVLVAALLLRGPVDDGSGALPVAVVPGGTAAPDSIELLGAGEDLDLASENDPEFYAWVELAAEAPDDGIG